MIASSLTLSPRLGASPSEPAGRSDGYLVEDCANGYLIDPLRSVPVTWLAMQLSAMILGGLLAALGVGLLLVATAESILWWLGASVGCFLLSIGLMRLATRSLTPRIEVDLNRAELRELALHRNGAVTVVARYPFASLGAVHIDRTSKGQASLCVRFRDRSGRVEIARGATFDLEALRNRLGRDFHKAAG